MRSVKLPFASIAVPIKWRCLFQSISRPDILENVSRRLPFAFAICFIVQTGISQDRFVGVTNSEGSFKAGTVFSILSTDTTVSVHHKFLNVGHTPKCDLIRGADGNFYGTTPNNGSAGSVFKWSAENGMSVIRYFDPTTTGVGATGGLTKGPDGNLYGMTQNDFGIVYRVTTSGHFEIVSRFTNLTGKNPVGKLVLGKDGKLYGMTSNGGGNGYYGTIFSVTTSGTITVIKSFDQYSGTNPTGNLVQDTDSSFYGMTPTGGNYRYGTAFKVKYNGDFTVLHHFKTDSIGSSPYGSLIKGVDSSFYGMTNSGGQYNSGVIFRISTNGDCNVIKTLRSDSTGGNPRGSLVLNSDGNFYGLATAGGTYNAGTIFKCSPKGIFTVIRHLNLNSDGSSPFGSLYKDADGYFYGTTTAGGTYTTNISPGNGTLFKISPSGSFSVLFRFKDNAQGMYPANSLLQAKDGLYYGMAREGGKYGYGTIYKVCTDGSFATLHSFNRTKSGAWPSGNLIQTKDGTFYGMTPRGGSRDAGTIFKMTSAGTVTVIKNFNPDVAVYSPFGSLVEGKDGNLYGLTNNGEYSPITFFSITPTGTFKSWSYGNYNIYGRDVHGSLIEGQDGNFYGMATHGGANDYGTIFKITPTGVITLLWTFNYPTDGQNPYGDLILGKDGNFYGMTGMGGSYGGGTIFKLTASGKFSVLKHLSVKSTGGYPQGNLVQGSDGALYGLTVTGGRSGYGTLFKITTAGTFSIRHYLKSTEAGSGAKGSLIIQKPNPIATPLSITITQNTKQKFQISGSGGPPLTFSISTPPKNGTAVLSKDSLLYTPKSGFIGNDSLYFVTTWGCQKSLPAKVKFTVKTSTTSSTLFLQEPTESKISAFNNSLQLYVSPNPSSNVFTLQVKSRANEAINIRILDLLGRTVESWRNIKANSKMKIGSNYKPGIYYIEVWQRNQKAITKLVKIS